MMFDLIQPETLQAVKNELHKVKSKYPGPFHSVPEMYGVLAEEVAEVFDEVRKKDPNLADLKAELVQVIAVCIRGIQEL